MNKASAAEKLLALIPKLTDKDLGLPWTASASGNHNSDGVAVSRLNPHGMRVQVLAVRYQGTVASMCAEPLAQEVIRRVQAHTKLVDAIHRLTTCLSLASNDCAHMSEIQAVEKMLADIG